MRKALSIFISLIFGFEGFAQIDPPKLQIHHLTENFYVFVTHKMYDNVSFPANGMYLVTDSGVALFDAPWDTTQLQPLLDSIKVRHNKDVKLYIATHSHDDRTGGMDYYRSKGIKTYATIRTDEISKQRNEQRAEILMKNDTVFTLGKYTFQTFYPGAGHTPDNIVIWFPEQKVLYGGCLIKSTDAGTLGNLADANVAAWKTTMKNLKKKAGKPKFVVPGHQRWGDYQLIKHTEKLVREYLRKN